MAKAVSNLTTSRRRLLSSGAALTLVTAAAVGLASCDPLPALGAEAAQPDASADAELLRLLAEGTATNHAAAEVTAHYVRIPPEALAEQRRLQAIGDRLINQAILLPAVTAEGRLAKLHFIMARQDEDLSDGSWRDEMLPLNPEERMLWSLAHDLGWMGEA